MGYGDRIETTTYDCLACGRCCYAGPNYVEVFPEDLVKLGPARVREFVVKSTLAVDKRRAGENDSTRFMRMENGHCAALDPQPGRYACTVYADRPLLCEVYEPGSPDCLKARAAGHAVQ